MALSAGTTTGVSGSTGLAETEQTGCHPVSCSAAHTSSASQQERHERGNQPTRSTNSTVPSCLLIAFCLSRHSQRESNVWGILLIISTQSAGRPEFERLCSGGLLLLAACAAVVLAGHDYQLPVRSVAAAAAAAAAEAAVQAMDGVPASSISLLDSPSGGSSSSSDGNLGSSPKIQKRVAPPGFFVREVESSDGVPHADGTLEILELKKRSSGGGSSGSRQRWWDEKRVRVWLPPGFSAENPPPGGWPALIMCDGQNMFEDWLAHQGVSWHLGHAASGLISVAAIPPCVCIAVDSAGPYR